MLLSDEYWPFRLCVALCRAECKWSTISLKKAGLVHDLTEIDTWLALEGGNPDTNAGRCSPTPAEGIYFMIWLFRSVPSSLDSSTRKSNSCNGRGLMIIRDAELRDARGIAEGLFRRGARSRRLIRRRRLVVHCLA